MRSQQPQKASPALVTVEGHVPCDPACELDIQIKRKFRSKCPLPIARLVLDDWNSESSELLMKLEWLPIASRISYSKMVLVYKILNNMCPG